MHLLTALHTFPNGHSLPIGKLALILDPDDTTREKSKYALLSFEMLVSSSLGDRETCQQTARRAQSSTI